MAVDSQGATGIVTMMLAIIPTNEPHTVTLGRGSIPLVREGQKAPFPAMFNGTTINDDPEGVTEHHLYVAIVEPIEGDAIVWDPVGPAGTGTTVSSDGFWASTAVSTPISVVEIPEVMQGFRFKTDASDSLLRTWF